jgi:uncharacterized protein
MQFQPDATLSAVPVSPGERIPTLDILRAFALLGILVMNLPGMYTNWWVPVMPEQRWPAWYDRAAIFITECFFAGKFNSLFSFLFGIGFTIQLERLMSRSAHPIPIYLRRLAYLLLFGIAHAIFIWTGDVLHIYAVLGMLLVLVRKASDKLVLALICVGLLLPTAMSIHRVLTYTAADEKKDRAMVDRMGKLVEQAYGHGTYAEATRVRALEMKETYSDPRSLRFYPTLFMTILLGFYVGRKKYIQESGRHLPFIRRVAVWSFVIGIACAISFATARQFLVPFKPTWLGVFVSTMFSWQRPALMLFYASSLVLLIHHARWGKLLAPLAYTGRMPLTNYLAQSVIGTTIFYGYGLGFWNHCGPALGLALSVLIYAIQVQWSIWWFKRFQFGPAEWLWRALTYGHAPAMRPSHAISIPPNTAIQ